MDAEEEWFLNVSKSHLQQDIYASRCWLLTAKSIFPQSFRLQFEEYMLELSKNNLEECGKVLHDIFRDFPNESKLWEEVEILMQATEDSSDPQRKEIFKSLPVITQQRMILACADTRKTIAQYCRLMMLLMNRFPETVPQYGLAIVDKLIEAEKRESEVSPVNPCRKLLVREVLPIICTSGNVDVSHKHFYKWLQKATEFYVTYYTSGNESDTASVWPNLEQFRLSVASRCGWNTEDSAVCSTSLSDRMVFMRDLFRRSRTDVDGAVNRKQIFYTTIILLFEAASKYMQAVDPGIFEGCEKVDKPCVHVANIGDAPLALSHSKRAADANEAFHVAKEAWSILYAIETFEKDFNHLSRRWKCDKWIWFQLHLADMHSYDGNHRAALSRLKQIEQKLNDVSLSPNLIRRVYCHLASACFMSNSPNESCEYIFLLLEHMPRNEAPLSADQPTRLTLPTECASSSLWIAGQGASPTAKLQTVLLTVDELLPFCVHVFLESLQRVTLSVGDDQTLGHMIILSQHDWPRCRPQCSRVLKRIVENRSFKFELFFKYIINIDILEEIAFMKNHDTCKLILHEGGQERTHATRGANREVDEAFWSAMKQNVQRSGEDVNRLLHRYIVDCKDSLASCLNLIEPR